MWTIGVAGGEHVVEAWPVDDVEVAVALVLADDLALAGEIGDVVEVVRRWSWVHIDPYVFEAVVEHLEITRWRTRMGTCSEGSGPASCDATCEGPGG
jgi:hypothetical protein